ncbi:MAG: hypothetical protein A2V70_09525 [Planctomycetes bacterium RBG_13_63_9]|nr:MAG: hypothetical protein A2V70_09525 [Planctomycetes bacterium RBG_13_63_9]
MRRLLATFAVLGFVLAATTPTLGQPAASLGDTSTIYLGDGDSSGNQWTGDGAAFGDMPTLYHVNGDFWVNGDIWAENGFDIYVPTYSTEWNTTQWPYAGQATGHNFPDYDHYGLLFDTRDGTESRRIRPES